MNAQYVDQRRFNGAVYLYECDANPGDRDLSREKARKQFTRESSLESEHETSSGSRYFPVLFDQELRIPANQMFTISAAVSVNMEMIANLFSLEKLKAWKYQYVLF